MSLSSTVSRNLLRTLINTIYRINNIFELFHNLTHRLLNLDRLPYLGSEKCTSFLQILTRNSYILAIGAISPNLNSSAVLTRASDIVDCLLWRFSPQN